MKKLSILVVDDDPGVASLAQTVLERAQHAVTVVATVDEAVQLLRRNCFDVLLTDMVVGDEDGAVVVREACLLHSANRVVAMSGGGDRLASACQLKSGVGLGGSYPLKKPFTPKQLLEAVEGTAAESPASV